MVQRIQCREEEGLGLVVVGVSGSGLGWSGRGRGWRCSYRATGFPGWARAGYGYPLYRPEFTAKDEINVLKDQADFLKRQLEGAQNRIEHLERGKKQESE